MNHSKTLKFKPMPKLQNRFEITSLTTFVSVIHMKLLQAVLHMMKYIIIDYN